MTSLERSLENNMECPSRFDYSIMNSLPDEVMIASYSHSRRVSVVLNYTNNEFQVLSNVFYFMPLSDRKNVRLACRRWYHCSTRGFITENEKFVFRSAGQEDMNRYLEDITTCIFGSKLPLVNIEFQCIPLTNLPATTWSKCGHRIRALEFYCCGWNVQTLRDIIVHCVNLKTFAIFHHEIIDSITVNAARDLLRELADQGLERPQLRSFSMCTNGAEDVDNLLSDIPLVFTGIRKFRIARTMNFDRDISVSDIVMEVEQDSVGSTLIKLLTSVFIQLENPEVDGLDGEGKMELLEQVERGLRLVPFTISVILIT